MNVRTTKTDRGTGESPTSAATQRDQMIAVAAYYRAERRGFHQGDPIVDWLEAEIEVDRMLHSRRRRGKPVDTKESFQKKIENQLKEWDERLDELREKANASKLKTRAEMQKQLDAVARNRAVLVEKLGALRKHSENAWEDLKDGTAKAWEEMQESIEHIADRLK